MAKALELNPDSLDVVSSIPQAAQAKSFLKEGLTRAKAARVEREPLQVRWPTEDVKAAKLAALQMDFPTVSEFMLACFHAYMQDRKA